jgi:hypothetical protein
MSWFDLINAVAIVWCVGSCVPVLVEIHWIRKQGFDAKAEYMTLRFYLGLLVMLVFLQVAI